MRSMKLAFNIILLGLIVAVFGGCQPPSPPGAIVDDMGRVVNIEESPQRIVSHVPSITETLFAIGVGDRVVGVSEYCDYPEAARAKPKIGGAWDPSIESIVELEPNLVLTSGVVESLMPQLDGLGITYIVLKPFDIDGILKNIELLGKVTGAAKEAEALIDDMQSRITSVTGRVKDAGRPRVFYAFAVTDLNNPWTAGPGSYGDALIRMAGGENIGARASIPWPQFSIEEVASSDPEIIIVNATHGTAATSVEAIRQHPVWRETTAVKQGRVYMIDGDLIERSGPRIVQGLEELARIIHPELYE